MDSWSARKTLEAQEINNDRRFNELSRQLDKLVSSIEYAADKRVIDSQWTNLHDRVVEVQKELVEFKHDIQLIFENLRRETTAEHTRLEKLVSDESESRKREHENYLREKRSAIRWFVSVVIIPITIAIIDYITTKH